MGSCVCFTGSSKGRLEQIKIKTVTLDVMIYFFQKVMGSFSYQIINIAEC